MAHALFQASIKIILKKDGKILALRTTDDYLDFPGGRLDETEIQLDHKQAVLRELKEELGDSIKVKVGKLAFVSRRSYSHQGTKNYVLAIFYLAEYQSGDINLSDEHSQYVWLTPDEIFKPGTKFISPDEEKQLKAYFKAE
jgi:8-oxo-dGTP diphosphatase